MRPAKKRERAIAVHEAAHLAESKWLKFSVEVIRIRRVGDDTKGQGTFMCPAWPEGWQTDKEAGIKLKVLFYKYIMLYSVGYLAEFMFSGPKEFWQWNHAMMEQTEKTDLQALREVSRVIHKKEFRDVVIATHDFISRPDYWGAIIAVAEILLKHRIIRPSRDGWPDVLVRDDAEEMEPEHNPKELIEFLVEGIYSEKKTK